MDYFLSLNNLSFVPLNDSFKKICMLANNEFDKLEIISKVYHNYGLYFKLKKDNDNMKKYYLMAIEFGNTNAMNNLGYYYEKRKDYNNMKKYYLMAIEQGNTAAMFNLGVYYEDQCLDHENQSDYEKNMKKYYLMAIKKGDMDAMYNLGDYYEGKKDYSNMEKYYLMAIKLDNNHDMNNLMILKLVEYYNNGKEFDKIIELYDLTHKTNELILFLNEIISHKTNLNNNSLFIIQSLDINNENMSLSLKLIVSLLNKNIYIIKSHFDYSLYSKGFNEAQKDYCIQLSNLI